MDNLQNILYVRFCLILNIVLWFIDLRKCMGSGLLLILALRSLENLGLIMELKVSAM